MSTTVYRTTDDYGREMLVTADGSKCAFRVPNKDRAAWVVNHNRKARFAVDIKLTEGLTRSEALSILKAA